LAGTYEDLEKQSKLAIVDLPSLIHIKREEARKAMLGVQMAKFTIESVLVAIEYAKRIKDTFEAQSQRK